MFVAKRHNMRAISFIFEKLFFKNKLFLCVKMYIDIRSLIFILFYRFIEFMLRKESRFLCSLY